MSKESNPFLRAALAYASLLHWPVFPLKPRSKEPDTEHGFQDATLDEQVIRAWWAKRPDANIGIPTGIKFWALDIDPRHGGDESLGQLVAKHGPLADTIRQTTGGGGQQYLYLLPDQQVINCHTAVWPGIDVRGAGGYIVVPPSIHPSGKPYLWDTAKTSILDELLQPAHSWLTSGIIGARHQANGQPFHLPEKIKKGVQHRTLFQMGAAMRAKGCGYDEIFAALWEVNQNRCEEPGPRSNIEKLARSISTRYEPRTSGPENMQEDFDDREIPANGAPGHSSHYRKPIFNWRSVGCVWDLEVTMNWLIDGFLPEGGVTLLSGDSGSGKSIFATAIAGAVVNGTPFLGMATKKRRVLYMDRENPLSAVRQHLFDLHIERNLDLIYWGTWCEHPPDSPAAASLLEFAREEKPLIIFDALVAFHQGDEQSATDTRAYLQHYRNLASAGATILLLHHTGKSENSRQYRGSSDIKAAVDCACLLERLGDPAGLISDLRLVPFKNRFTSSKAWSLVFENGSFRSQNRSETTREIMERLVRDNPGSSYEELRDKARASGLSKHQAETLIVAGAADGRFELRKAGRRNLYFIREVELGEV